MYMHRVTADTIKKVAHDTSRWQTHASLDISCISTHANKKKGHYRVPHGAEGLTCIQDLRPRLTEPAEGSAEHHAPS